MNIVVAQVGLNELDITYQFTVWFDILVVFLPLTVPSGNHNNKERNEKGAEFTHTVLTLSFYVSVCLQDTKKS